MLDIVRTGAGPDASRKWATACMLSGECIKACDYGVNPRFLLAMARVAMVKAASEHAERRRQGVHSFRNLSQDVDAPCRACSSTVRCSNVSGRGRRAVTEPGEAPDFVFYTGCNVLKTPHIALLALDIMDALGVSYRVMGGPSHCCGVLQLRAGDTEMSGTLRLELDREAVAARSPAR